MKALVFGGTGWVGHSIVKAFHEDGADVTIFETAQWAAKQPKRSV